MFVARLFRILPDNVSPVIRQINKRRQKWREADDILERPVTAAMFVGVIYVIILRLHPKLPLVSPSLTPLSPYSSSPRLYDVCIYYNNISCDFGVPRWRQKKGY